MPDYDSPTRRDRLTAAFYLAFVFPVLPLLVGTVVCQLLGVPVGQP